MNHTRCKAVFLIDVDDEKTMSANEISLRTYKRIDAIEANLVLKFIDFCKSDKYKNSYLHIKLLSEDPIFLVNTMGRNTEEMISD